MPTFVRSESLCGHHDIAAALSLEFRISPLEEQKQLFHHISNIGGIHKRETQFHCAPSNGYIWILQAFLKYIMKVLIIMDNFHCEGYS